MHIQQLIKPKLFFPERLCTFVLKGAVSFLQVDSLFLHPFPVPDECFFLYLFILARFHHHLR
jgi:hypothetical protein